MMENENVEYMTDIKTRSGYHDSSCEYQQILALQFDKCFRQSNRATLTVINDTFMEAIIIVKEKGKYCPLMEIDYEYNPDSVFAAMCSHIFDADITGCTLQVDTDQRIDGEIVKEIYGFCVMRNGEVINLTADEVENSQNTHAETGEALIPTKHIVYCDVDGGCIPAFDLM